MNKRFDELCTPAKLYFVLAVVSCVIALFNGVKIMAVAVNLIIAFLWTAALSWICGKGFSGVSWFLVLFTYIVMLLVFFKISKDISKHQVMVVVPPSATQQMMM
jgi:F0F1-type ATP synthase assembly protein I